MVTIIQPSILQNALANLTGISDTNAEMNAVLLKGLAQEGITPVVVIAATPSIGFPLPSANQTAVSAPSSTETNVIHTGFTNLTGVSITLPLNKTLYITTVQVGVGGVPGGNTYQCQVYNSTDSAVIWYFDMAASTTTPPLAITSSEAPLLIVGPFSAAKTIVLRVSENTADGGTATGLLAGFYQ